MNKEISLTHHGIKGMRWGIRRFQNKDGSLTPAGKKRQKDADEPEETIEETRARVLKSTNAAEIYKNRSLLSTNELNERINRINAEKRLSEIAQETKKSGYDYVDKALKFGRKANEIYEFSNSSIMKAIKSKLTGKKDEGPTTSLKGLPDDLSLLSDEKIQKILKRATQEQAIKKILSNAMKKVEEDS